MQSLPLSDRRLAFFVPGIPQPQGSKTVGRAKSGRSFVREDNPEVRPWRTLVAAMAGDLWEGEALPPRTSVAASMLFVFPRPAGHYGARGIAPRWSGAQRVYTKPDLDKLVRAVCDALQGAGVVSQDSQINEYLQPFGKWYADPGQPWGAQAGVHVRLEW